ncbi:hypothetical protein E4U58_000207 [Claviceps cyperi]|nr:hypothetical protein E4U58_000207 [Claviceps cyperi]
MASSTPDGGVYVPTPASVSVAHPTESQPQKQSHQADEADHAAQAVQAVQALQAAQAVQALQAGQPTQLSQPQQLSQQPVQTQQQQHHPQNPLPTVSQNFQQSTSNVPNAHGQPRQSQLQYGQSPNVNENITTFESPRTANNVMSASSSYQNLLQVMKATDRATVRHVVRDCHEATLLGSEYHHAFLLNTCFHQAAPATLDTSVQRFGGKLVSSSLKSFLTHTTPEMLDSVSDLLLSKLSTDFLDKALDKRLSTIRARSLVNALAKAERLGYDARDVVVEGRTGSEHVVPHLKPNLAQDSAQGHPSPYPQQPQPQPQLQLQLQPQPQPKPQPKTQPKPQPKPKPQPQQQLQPQPQPQLPPSYQPPSISKTTEARTVPPPAGQAQDSSRPLTLMYCETCGRPCSGVHALRYHGLKKNCENLQKYERINRDICAHCGTVFSNSSGLVYHTKSQVCGNYGKGDVAAILPWLAKFYRQRPASESKPAAPAAPAASAANGAYQPPPSSSPTTGQTLFTGIDTHSNFSTPTSYSLSKATNAYAHLSPRDKATFDSAMQLAEDKYSEEMKQLLSMDLSPAEREMELGKLKNRFNAKQSITRKKFGIRLRERRPRYEIEAERSRIMSSTAAQSPRSSTQTHAHGHTNSPRISTGESASRKQRTSLRVEFPGPRRLSEEGPLVVSDLPPRVPVEEMGGLDNSAGTAAHFDPTASLSYSELSASGSQSHDDEVIVTSRGAAKRRSRRAVTSRRIKRRVSRHGDVISRGGPATGATAHDPMDIDDRSECPSDSEESETTGEEDEIPSMLPYAG